jgi:hypothetical protein
MIAIFVKNKIILEMPDRIQDYRLERRAGGGGEWLVFTASGFVEDAIDIIPVPAHNSFVDISLQPGLYQYRARIFDNADAEYDYSMWIRCGNTDPVGYTFGNYHAPDGAWGEVVTTDDIRLSYLWGVDFKASVLTNTGIDNKDEV